MLPINIQKCWWRQQIYINTNTTYSPQYFNKVKKDLIYQGNYIYLQLNANSFSSCIPNVYFKCDQCLIQYVSKNINIQSQFFFCRKIAVYLIETHINNRIYKNLIPSQHVTFFSDCAFIKNEYEIREVIVSRQKIIFKICSVHRGKHSLPNNKLTALNKWFYFGINWRHLHGEGVQ